MTSSLTLNPVTENKVDTCHEIMYPQGEFWSDEPPLETYQHLQQIIILLKSLQWLWQDKQDYFCAGNLTIYYSPNQKKSEYFRGPDFFVVLNTTNDETRKSWVVWEEGGKYPNVIVEILSDSTAKFDRDGKKAIYQDIFRTPDYFWFDPFTLEFQGFTLISGTYQPIKANEKGWLYSEQLELYLGLHEGKLRYFTPNGELVATPEESAMEERQQAQIERQQKELAKQQAQIERQQKELALQEIAQLKEKLKQLGINLDEII
ncbi:Uma2 family endonuclease [Geminocystis sp. CENA526]|uniref:Uma2 family endonuclease n=1 Tax=Geminocystis sp. CENA526 TaxID=1355871 RepID=UPI003D6DCDFF